MIASFRMYNAGASAASAWRALFNRVFADAGLDIEIIEHAAPRPLDELWAREDLACGFMCGWPFVRSPIAMQAVAVPVPAEARYEGQPRYCSEFLVRDATGWGSLEDTFGQRFGWMSAGSHSGFNAPRAHLANHLGGKRARLYSQVIGPLGTPASSLDALRAGQVDVVALDSFYLDLLRRHAPQRLDGIRTVGTTTWSPIPLLVAAPAIPAATVAKLRAHLVAMHENPANRALLEEVCVNRFVEPRVEAYRALEEMARDAAAKGYDTIR